MGLPGPAPRVTHPHKGGLLRQTLFFKLFPIPALIFEEWGIADGDGKLKVEKIREKMEKRLREVNKRLGQ